MLWFIDPRINLSNRPVYLNTSYVMVHPMVTCDASGIDQDLNTSYVMVHQSLRDKFPKLAQFKYILCYGSSTVCPF